MDTVTQICAHQPCNCMVKADEEVNVDSYCSETCKAQDSEEEQEACPCGHPPCDIT